MSVKVIMFGRLADISENSVTINDVVDTDDLVNSLHKKYPALAGAKYVIAVNKKVIKENTVLDNDCIVALLPPFSGG